MQNPSYTTLTDVAKINYKTYTDFRWSKKVCQRWNPGYLLA